MPAGRARKHTHEPIISLTRLSPLRLARSVLNQEGTALQQLAARLNQSFCDATDMILKCGGNVVVTGIGKAGLVGRKTSATLSSLATPSHFLHPSEALHGDLGKVTSNDVVLILSYSGESEEVVRLLPCLRKTGATLVAITSREESSVGRGVDCVITLGSIEEADPLGLAPSTSTTAMLAVGDALALSVAQQRRFNSDDFARNHPGGSLGRKLMPVEEAMRGMDRCRVANENETIREILAKANHEGRRTGAILLVDNNGCLTGIFTDSDLARLFEKRREAALDRPVAEVMSRSPSTVTTGTLLPTAIRALAAKKISELPVVDRQGKPVGLIDITDVVIADGESAAGDTSLPFSESA